MEHTLKTNFPDHSKYKFLSKSPILRYFNFTVLYFAQGVPEGMLLFGIPAWMAMNDKSPGEIAGFTVACGLPWSLKFLLAPMMDRYTYLPMGRKRPWVIGGQLGLVLSLIYLALVDDPLNNLNQFMIAGFLVSLFGAFQDVAVDGMAIDLIPDHEQAKANGLMWGSKIVGVSVSLALGSWLLNKVDFFTSICTLALVIAIIMLVPILLRERAGEKIAPWTPGKTSEESKQLQVENWKLIFKSLFRVFRLKNSLLITIVLFLLQGSFNYLGTLLPIFTVKELGWTNVFYSEHYAAAKLIGGIVGMLVGGILIDKFGKKMMLNIYFFLLILGSLILALSTKLWSNTTFISGFMIWQNILVTFASIGILAIAMQCCWKKVSASQFTLFMTIGNLGRIVIAALIGPIKSNFNWQITLLAFVLFVALTWTIFQYLSIDSQLRRITEMDQQDIDSKVLAMAAN